jgi:hypothetical protein
MYQFRAEEGATTRMKIVKIVKSLTAFVITTSSDLKGYPAPVCKDEKFREEKSFFWAERESNKESILPEKLIFASAS